MDLYRDLLIVAFAFEIIVKYQQRNSLPYFLHYLTLLILCEKVLRPYIPLWHGNNYWFYNILIIIQVQYYAIIFGMKYPEAKGSKRILIVSIGLSIISLFNFLFIQGMSTVNNISYLVGLTFVVIIMGLYFWKLISMDYSGSLFTEPIFWLSVGILLFYASCFPQLVFVNEIVENGNNIRNTLYILVQFGNIFLSLAYIMVPLCSLMTRSSSKI